MDAPLSVLLRDNTHASANVRLALKAEQVAISYARTTIQIPQVQGNPTILDLGQVRPSITISGIVDTVGGDPENTANNEFNKMESMTVSGQTYYIPYKNYLEKRLLTWVTNSGYVVQLELGDATQPDWTSNTASTGGGIYEVAVQQAQFTIAPGTEDRWIYSIQFVAKIRAGITF